MPDLGRSDGVEVDGTCAYRHGVLKTCVDCILRTTSDVFVDSSTGNTHVERINVLVDTKERSEVSNDSLLTGVRVE